MLLLLYRFWLSARWQSRGARGHQSKFKKTLFRSFYFDTALCSSKGQLLALSEATDWPHILFGSDYPTTSFEEADFLTKQLDNFCTTKEREPQRLFKMINREHGLKLFPKFGKAVQRIKCLSWLRSFHIHSNLVVTQLLLQLPYLL